MIVKQEILMEEIANLLADTRQVVLKAKGRSMSPYIRDGIDSLVIEKTDNDAIATGDVVLARTSDRRYVMHRVIKAGPETLILKGDGNVFGTEICRRADVIGMLTFVERPDGKRVDCNTPSQRAKAWVLRQMWRTPRKAYHYLRKLMRI